MSQYFVPAEQVYSPELLIPERKPIAPVVDTSGVNWSTYYLFQSNNKHDSERGSTLQLENQAEFVTSGIGSPYLYGDGSDDYAKFSKDIVGAASPYPFSVMFQWEKLTSDAGNGYIFSSSRNDGFFQGIVIRHLDSLKLAIFIGDNTSPSSSDGARRFITDDTYSVNQIRRCVLVCTSNTTGYFCIDGKEVPITMSGSGGDYVAGPDPSTLLKESAATPVYGNLRVGYFAFAHEAVPLAKAIELSKDPFQFLRPSGPQWLPMEAPIGATLSVIAELLYANHFAGGIHL